MLTIDAETIYAEYANRCSHIWSLTSADCFRVLMSILEDKGVIDWSEKQGRKLYQLSLMERIRLIENGQTVLEV